MHDTSFISSLSFNKMTELNLLRNCFLHILYQLDVSSFARNNHWSVLWQNLHCSSLSWLRSISRFFNCYRTQCPVASL